MPQLPDTCKYCGAASSEFLEDDNSGQLICTQCGSQLGGIHVDSTVAGEARVYTDDGALDTDGRENRPSRRNPRTIIPSPQFCIAVLGRMSAASLRLKYHRAYSYLSHIARKDQLRALCGAVPGMLVVRPSMSAGASGKTMHRMLACIKQRVAAVRAAATLEGALLAERLIWDGPMRSRSLEKSIKNVI
jgi:hypothetical protein